MRQMITKLQIEPTTRCNYKCVFCTRSGYSRSRIGDMSLESFKEIIHQFLPDLKYVKVQGMGEPMLCPQLREMLAYAKGVLLRTEVITNGSVFNKEIAEAIDILGISMSAGEATAYKKITGSDNFEEVLKNAYEYVGAIPFVWFNFVLTKNNLDQLEKLVDLALTYAIRYINVQPAQCWLTSQEKGYKKHKAFSPTEEVLPQIKRKAFEKGVTLHIVEYENRISCDFPATMPFVTWDGYLTPCCLRPNKDIFNFGNLLTEGLEAILRGEKYQSFVTSLKEGNFPALCKGCTL